MKKPKRTKLTGKSQLWNDPAANEIRRLEQTAKRRCRQAEFRMQKAETSKAPR